MKHHILCLCVCTMADGKRSCVCACNRRVALYVHHAPSSHIMLNAPPTICVGVCNVVATKALSIKKTVDWKSTAASAGTAAVAGLSTINTVWQPIYLPSFLVQHKSTQKRQQMPINWKQTNALISLTAATMIRQHCLRAQCDCRKCVLIEQSIRNS